MISIDNLEKLYDGIIDGKELTTKQLNKYGFNSTDINKLIEDNVIERVKRGFYSFKDVNSLLNYARKYSYSTEKDKVFSCYEKCYELDPNNTTVCFQLFVKYICDKKYDKVFELFDKLSCSDNNFYRVDYNYYLLLLSYITDIPDKYHKNVKNLDYYSIKISHDDKRYSDVSSYNRIRSASTKGKFTFAYKLLNEITNKNGKSTIHDIIEKNLLTQVINEEAKSRRKVNSLIREKKYEELIDYYGKKKKIRGLNNVEGYLVKLANIYLKIMNSSNVPKIKEIDTDNLFYAINENRFDLALKISEEFNRQRNIPNKDNALYNILKDICDLIDSLKKDNTDKQEEIEFKDFEEKSKKMEPKSNNYFMFIISSLMNNDIDSALKYLKEHLNEIDKSEYEYIITNLIKISILEKDIAYTAPMMELSLMNNKNYQFNTTNYIQKFYLALSNEKIEEAEIYLNIISNSIKINNETLNMDALYKVLDSYKEKNRYQVSTPVIEEEKPLKQETIINLETRNKDDNQHDYEQEDENIEENDSKEYDYNEEEKHDINLIKKKHDELIKNKGIIILNSMNKDRTNFILNEADKYLDMSVFTIIDEGKKRIVLRYNELNYEDFDTATLISESLDDYRHRFYDDCLNKQIKILETNSKEKSVNYAMIGLAYMKMFKIDKAIDFLTVANYLAKQEHSTRDYGDLLLRLKGEIDKDDIKPNVRMNQCDFKNDDKFYGIENFEELNDYICESELDVESACRNLNMSDEDIDTLKLIYAREYFTLGNKEKGELFLRSFEKSKTKTDKTKDIYKIVQQNKKFYKARFEGEPRQLSLKLIPKK